MWVSAAGGGLCLWVSVCCRRGHLWMSDTGGAICGCLPHEGSSEGIFCSLRDTWMLTLSFSYFARKINPPQFLKQIPFWFLRSLLLFPPLLSLVMRLLSCHRIPVEIQGKAPHTYNLLLITEDMGPSGDSFQTMQKLLLRLGQWWLSATPSLQRAWTVS